MIFKNIDFYNVDEITEENGEYVLHRFPVSVENALSEHNGNIVNRRNIGVELRFVMKSDTVKLKFKASEGYKAVPVTVMVGDLENGTGEQGIYITDNGSEITLTKKGLDMMGCNAKMYESVNGRFDMSVIRVCFQWGYVHFLGVEGEVEPPSADLVPKTKMYAYGSSITSGMSARGYELGYVPLTAKNLGADLINRGMPGACCIQKEVADYISKQNFDIGLFELGVNILADDVEKDFGRRLDYFLKTVIPPHKDKKIFLISPFFMWDDFGKGKPAELYRKEFVRVLGRYGFENVVYIDGLELLNEPELLRTDAIHPDTFGHQLMAERLTKIIKDNI